MRTGHLPYGATLTPKGLSFVGSRPSAPPFGWWWLASPLVLVPVLFGFYVPAVVWMASLFGYLAWSRTTLLGAVEIELRSDRMVIDGIGIPREPMDVVITGRTLRRVDSGVVLTEIALDDMRARWLERAIAAWSRGRPLPHWTPVLDPKAIGVLEPGRQTIAVVDRIFTPVDALVVLGSGVAAVLVAAGWVIARIPLGPWVAAAFPWLGLALGGFAVWWRSGPTVLVLREGGLTLSQGRKSWSAPLTDILAVRAVRRRVNSQVILEIAGASPAVVSIGGLHRAEALAAAILAAREAHAVDAEADAEARRAFERLRGLGATAALAGDRDPDPRTSDRPG